MSLRQVWKVFLLLPTLVACFGNEYVHIKVHVPKDQAPSIALDAEPVTPPHKVIHHYHHHHGGQSASPHQRSRARGVPKLKTSPLLESVILSDLDKPLHMSEHADYLNHAKELAEHLSETYVVKKAAPPPPKKKVNTYTIIEEKHRAPSSYDYGSRPEQDVDTYRVIDSHPQHASHHHHHSQKHYPSHKPHYHQDEDDDDIDVGYRYTPPERHHRHQKSQHGGYPEPAPVEEPLDFDQGYNYAPLPPPPPPLSSYAAAKSAHSPAHTLEAPDALSSLNTQYPYDYVGTNGFRPSPQLIHQPDVYAEDDSDTYGPPVVTQRRRRPSSTDWSSRSSYHLSVPSETYLPADSYNVGHTQGLTNSGYQQTGPYL